MEAGLQRVRVQVRGRGGLPEEGVQQGVQGPERVHPPSRGQVPIWTEQFKTLCVFDLGRWKHECNSCSCLSGGVVKCSKDQCTKKCKDEQGYTHQVNVSLKRLSDSLAGWRHLEQGVRQQLQVHCKRAGGVHEEPLQVQGRAGVHPPSGRPVDQPVQELHLWIRGESLLQADRLQEHLHR